MYVTIPGERHAARPPLLQTKATAKTQYHHIATGTHLFREGEEARAVYEVVTGVLRLTRVTEDGRRQVIAFGYPGDIVGFPSDGEYHTDGDALCPTTLITYMRSALEIGAGNAELHRRLLQAALREISAMQDHFMMLGCKSASEKLASFLCTLSDRFGCPLGQFIQFTLPMSRSDIADFLGLTTETISRSFTQLRKSGVIALDNIHTVIVLKPDVLLALAEGED